MAILLDMTSLHVPVLAGELVDVLEPQPGQTAIDLRVSSSASGSRPQAHTGRSGGQMQPRARSARKRLTRRSSRE